MPESELEQFPSEDYEVTKMEAGDMTKKMAQLRTGLHLLDTMEKKDPQRQHVISLLKAWHADTLPPDTKAGYRPHRPRYG